MSSYISSFKSIFIAFVFIIIIEIILSALPNQGYANRQFLEFSLFRNTSMQKMIIYEKLEHLATKQADIIIIGDSSSLYNLQPTILHLYLGSVKAVNLSCCADTGFDGYLHIAKYAIKNNPRVKHIILNVTPTIKNNASYKLTKSIYDNYISWKSYINPPSFKWRIWATNLIYYHNSFRDYTYMMRSYSPNTTDKYENPESFKQIIEHLHSNNGWLSPVFDFTEPMEYHICGFNIQNAEILKKNLEKTYKFSRRHNVRLIILYSPVICIKNNADKSAAMLVDSFKISHQDVLVPLEYGEFWSKQFFNNRHHLNMLGSMKFSHKVGKELSKYLNF